MTTTYSALNPSETRPRLPASFPITLATARHDVARMQAAALATGRMDLASALQCAAFHLADAAKILDGGQGHGL
jgi:hypothetical protein